MTSIQLISIIFLIIINFLLCKNSFKISKFFNLIDRPNKHSLHKKETPIFGGILFVINIIFFFILSGFENLYFILTILSFFLLGLYDDIYNINPNLRLTIASLVLCIFFYLDGNFIISELKIINYFLINNKIFLFFFSILCILLFVNSINLIDGINGLSGLILLFYLVYLILISYGQKIDFDNKYIFLITFIFFLYYNLNGKIFMGDSGVYLLSSFVALLTVKFHNYNILEPFDIFLLFLIPGIDMFRLFCERIANNKNPFLKDNNHIHHLLLKKFNYKIFQVNTVILAQIILFNMLNFFFDSYTFIFILINLILYCYLVYFFRSKIK